MSGVFVLVFLSLIVLSKGVFANPACAVCTVAIGASLGLARKFGVDDNVVAIWAGAMLSLVGYWSILWFDKKGWKFPGRDLILMALSVGMVGFMFVSELRYSACPILFFYMDPFLFFTIFGALLFIYSSKFYQWMKKKNGGHAHFPFEKVVVPVLALVLASVLITYFPVEGVLR